MTETTMRRAVPPIARASMPVIERRMSGRIAIKPRKSAPTRVRRVMILAMYSEVAWPGRTPGMNAPDF